MLASQKRLAFSDYSSRYDFIILQDNLLRRINSLIDFSFVYDELVSKYCPDNGRIAQSPIRMFKYLLLKTIYDLSDIDAKYYTFDQQVVLSANTIQDVSNVKFDVAAMRADSIDASHVVSLVITAPAENKVNVNMNSVLIRVKME